MVVLLWGAILTPSSDIWQCLETFLPLLGGSFYWHLEIRGQYADKHPRRHKTSSFPTTKSYLILMSRVLTWRNPGRERVSPGENQGCVWHKRDVALAKYLNTLNFFEQDLVWGPITVALFSSYKDIRNALSRCRPWNHLCLIRFVLLSCWSWCILSCAVSRRHTALCYPCFLNFPSYCTTSCL